MMKSFPLLFLCLLGFVAFAAANVVELPSSVPLLVWSKQNFFEGNQQYLNTISNLDIEKLLQTSVGVETTIESSVDSLLNSLRSKHPEVVILFIESNLGTEQLCQLSSAYSRNATDSVFRNLKNSLGSATSSIIFPYTLSGNSFSLSETILEVSLQLHAQQPTASIYLVRPEGGQGLHNLASSPVFESKTPDQLLVELQNAPIYNNGATDLIVVSFNQNFAQDDAFLGTVEHIVSEKTEGNYLSMFSGLRPTRSRVLRQIQVGNDLDNVTYTGGTGCGSRDVQDAHNCNAYTTFFPIAVFQIIVVVVTLLIIVCFGIICTCSLQTPARFEVPKVKRTSENAM